VLVTCWSSKGGCGVTTVAASLALSLAAGGEEVLLVDLAGDLPAALGMPEPAGPGVSDWLAAHPHTDRVALETARRDVAPGLGLVPLGAGPLRGGPPLDALVEALATVGPTVVVDAGVVRAGDPALAAVAAASSSLLVLRPCYLALRRAVALPVRPSAVILVEEPGRALGRADIEAVLDVPVRAQVPADPAIARALDAGLLLSRLPRSLSRALRAAA
jgi:MinD-like ATPase involved in chromosome partitioning or flagellar assembly